MTKTKFNLGVVQETPLIPLWARAAEIKGTDPIIVDPKSAEMLEAIDYDFDKFATATNSQIGACLRGIIIDNWVHAYLQKHPQGSVVDIGTGLNTRFERVDNSEVSWFNLDLPDVMALRKQFFAETERRQLVKAADTQPCMFVAEGVLMFLSEHQVKQLFANLLREFPGSLFAFDSIVVLIHSSLAKYLSPSIS
ncbi:MAG: hypothetical protein N2235_05455 [Fischerella sp.]|nr:hypothetical protein [Fischerella sp.]